MLLSSRGDGRWISSLVADNGCGLGRPESFRLVNVVNVLEEVVAFERQTKH